MDTTLETRPDGTAALVAKPIVPELRFHSVISVDRGNPLNNFKSTITAVYLDRDSQPVVLTFTRKPKDGAYVLPKFPSSMSSDAYRDDYKEQW